MKMFLTATTRKKPGFLGWPWLTAVCLSLLFLGLIRQTALAHTRVEVGPYAIVIGWLAEPPIVGERNALTIEITEDDAPVTGAEATLDVELVYAGSTFRANLNPTETAGLYTAELFPTVRGQYTAHLFGSLGETEIDVNIEPEEVFPAARLHFPEPQPDPRELEQEITTLQNELQLARTLAYVGMGVGSLGILLAVVSLICQRR